MSSPPRADQDALFDGTLTLHQPARGAGYRVNVDAVLLAWFAGEPRRARRVVDLGAGVGAVGLCLLYRDRAAHVTFVEVDPALSALAAANLCDNGWAERGAAIVADVREAPSLALGTFDLVVCNPPYVEEGRGRPRKVGNAAHMGELRVFAVAARRLLGARGRACFVYPAGELLTLLETLRAAGLEAKRLRFVQPTALKPARVALVEAAAGKRGGLTAEPAFVEREGSGPTLALSLLLSAGAVRARAPSRGSSGRV